jgi:formamidopyrimidine-DNA glycosylase
VPELPEVETTVQDLKKKVLFKTFVDVWTDFPKMIKFPKNFEQFKKEIKGKKIKKIWRRGKNILFDLSQGKTLLIHQKLTGHLLYGIWQKKKEKWEPKIPGPLNEKINTFIHLLFSLDNGKMLALSDLRKFANVELKDKKELLESKEFKSLGPEPLEKDFTFQKFKDCLKGKKGKIKQILMDQNVIAGIGNIYSDEILFEAKVHPFKEVQKLNEAELKKIYKAIPKILNLAIKLHGESISDFRRISGQRGQFDKIRKVYRREGKECKVCGTIIKKGKLAGRSAHFCPKCQKL